MNSKSTSTCRSFFSMVFRSPDEPRLRAGWRLLIQTIIMLFLFACLGIPSGLLVNFPKNSISDQLFMLLNQGIAFFAITISVLLSSRFLDKRSISNLGLIFSNNIIRDLIFGFLISFLSLALIYFLEFLFGWTQFSAFAWEIQSTSSVITGVLLAFLVYILVGWNEELLSRGYHLQTLTSGTNLTLGLITSSAIFGTLHITNPSATWISTVGIFFAGLFFGFGYIRTCQLWLPIGLHIGWNFSEGVVFGFPVSGLGGFQIINNTFTGPYLWTGGPFGPEAGLIVFPGILLGTLLTYIYTLPKFRK